MRSKITFHIDEAQRVLTAIRDDAALLANLQASAEACFDILPRGGKTLLAGDGGDAFIGYSTSGQSPNILRTFEEARMKGIVCIGLKGSRSGPMQQLGDFLHEVPSSETPKIQEEHLVLGHILCGLVESALFKGAS